jgi:hypothetical protein
LKRCLKIVKQEDITLKKQIAIAYSLNTTRGQHLKQSGTRHYICRSKEAKRTPERHSDFWIGTYGSFWIESMDACSELAFSLMRLKPGKHSHFSGGLTAMRLMRQAF